MTLIADSGSTKTLWRTLNAGSMVVTEGLNPRFSTEEDFAKACAEVRRGVPSLGESDALHFYGAGCGSAVQRERVGEMLRKYLGISSVTVETDLLGACRAVCGAKEGLVGILGTGSNACYYDGNIVSYQTVSMGYILGDHGSANHVGRCLLRDYLSGQMPEDLRSMFHDSYAMTQEQIMDAVYGGRYPNRFLASLAPFALAHVEEPYCSGLLGACLDEWYRYQVQHVVARSGCRELSLVGGFAARLGGVLECFAARHGLLLREVAASPMEGLCRFHEGL